MDDDQDVHGTESCQMCGGYNAPMGVFGRNMVNKCRQCGTTTSKPIKNRVEDFIGAVAKDFE